VDYIFRCKEKLPSKHAKQMAFVGQQSSVTNCAQIGAGPRRATPSWVLHYGKQMHCCCAVCDFAYTLDSSVPRGARTRRKRDDSSIRERW
jgi:hypothetical protein